MSSVSIEAFADKLQIRGIIIHIHQALLSILSILADTLGLQEIQ
jgi:hypothetical protein